MGREMLPGIWGRSATAFAAALLASGLLAGCVDTGGGGSGGGTDFLSALNSVQTGNSSGTGTGSGPSAERTGGAAAVNNPPVFGTQPPSSTVLPVQQQVTGLSARVILFSGGQVPPGQLERQPDGNWLLTVPSTGERIQMFNQGTTADRISLATASGDLRVDVDVRNGSVTGTDASGTRNFGKITTIQ